MQEYTNEKMMALVLRSTKFTARTLEKAVSMYLRHHAQKKADPQNTRHGKMKVGKLLGLDQGAATIELKDDGLKDFNKSMKRYNVDYAIKKDKTVEPPKYIIFFKSRDKDAIAEAFKDYVHRHDKRAERPSLHERLNYFKDIVSKNKELEQSKERVKHQERTL